jgi:hypothetical protein
LSRFTPLGIQFWDAASDTPVSDGLTVTAQRTKGDYFSVPAKRTPSGIYAFQGLPHLRAVEDPSQHGSASSPPQAFEYVVAIEDHLGRFLPMVFGVTLPLGYRGLFLSVPLSSLPGGAGRAYLFSAPTRPVPPGMAAIRADLWDHEAAAPAAHAAVQVELAGMQWTAVASERGAFLLVVPYPTVARLQLGSPPGSGQPGFGAQTWPVTISVQCQPAKLRYPLTEKRDITWPWMDTPSLKSILYEQGPALIWFSESQPPVAAWTTNLTFGQELVLRTQLAGSQQASSLWISRGASPP